MARILISSKPAPCKREENSINSPRCSGRTDNLRSRHLRNRNCSRHLRNRNCSRYLRNRNCRLDQSRRINKDPRDSWKPKPVDLDGEEHRKPKPVEL